MSPIIYVARETLKAIGEKLPPDEAKIILDYWDEQHDKVVELESEAQRLREQYKILEDHHKDQNNDWVEACEELKGRLVQAQDIFKRFPIYDPKTDESGDKFGDVYLELPNGNFENRINIWKIEMGKALGVAGGEDKKEMIYKYTSLGMCLGGGKGGKISYLHENCAISLNTMLGPKAEPTGETPPNNTKCPYCGKVVSAGRGKT